MSNNTIVNDEDWGDFLIFTGFNYPRRQDEKGCILTIQRNKAIMSFSKEAFSALSSPKHVQLAYNAKKQTIGIRSCEESDNGSIPVIKLNCGKNCISGYSFVKEWNIDVSTLRRYEAKLQKDLEGRDVLTINTQECIPIQNEMTTEETKKWKVASQLKQQSLSDKQTPSKNLQSEERQTGKKMSTTAHEIEVSEKLKEDLKSMIMSTTGIKEDSVNLESILGNFIKELKVS